MRKEGGQVLILAVIMLVILVMAALFLFDLHNIIRSKIKLETAEQAAALAAANWQKETLNLIGDINLIKVSETMLRDFGNGETDEETFIAANQALTEMQSRISFVGPLIGYGAANQAAKYNGVNIHDSEGYKSVYQDFDEILANLEDVEDPRYHYWGSDSINNYYWREPYIAMLREIRSQGLAVRPSGRFPGLEGVRPRWLAQEDTYQAIFQALSNDYWCRLADILRLPDAFWNSRWWRASFQNTHFPEESEIYSVGIEFSNAFDHDAADAGLQEVITAYDPNWTALPALNLCIYDSRWFEYNANYSGPETEWWNDDGYLRRNLRNSFLYGGATAYAECYQKITTVSAYKSAMEKPGKSFQDQHDKAQNSLEYTVNGETRTLVRAVSDYHRSIRVGNDSHRGEAGGAAAKPLGSLAGGEQPPTAAVIVLPVFTNVTLIPSQMPAENESMMRAVPTKLDDFIEWLATVDDLNNPASEPPTNTAHYLAALQLLNNESFRRSGYNNRFNINSITDDIAFFGEEYKYSDANPNGAGRLQQVWVITDNTRWFGGDSLLIDEDSSSVYTRYWLDNRFFMRRKSDGQLMTYEHYRCRPSRGGGGRFTTGPSRL